VAVADPELLDRGQIGRARGLRHCKGEGCALSRKELQIDIQKRLSLVHIFSAYFCRTFVHFVIY